MQLISKTPEKIVLRIPADESLANAIRRSVSEVPTLAIDEAEIYKNDSALFDEVLAHRLGLLPLKTEKSMTEKTKIDLKLSKTGPCVVYSGDFKGPAKMVYKNMPLTILGKEHKLELVATAVLGKGLQHSKFNPGFAYYRHLVEVKSSPEIDKFIANSTLNSLIKPEKKGAKWLCDLNEAAVDEILKIDKEAISDSDELLFVIESFGMMDAKDILVKTIEALSDNLNELEKKVK